MADLPFTVRITTPADLSGAQATQAAFTTLTQQAAQVAASAGQAAQQEQGAAQAARTLAAAAEQAANHTGRFVDAAGRLREANGQYVATGNSAKAAGDQIAEAGRGAKTAGEQIKEADHQAEHLFGTLRAGFSIDFAHRLVEGVMEIPRALREAVQEGVRYNATMESLAIQLGGALRSADPAKYLNFADARAAGEVTLDQLRAKANQLGTDFHALAETFAINSPILASAGIRSVEEQIEAITLLQQVAAAKGISGFQAQRDIIDLLAGQGQRTLLGKELENQGVSNESIKRAKEMGTLMDLLREKLGAYGEAGQAAADTFNAAQTRLKNITEQLFGQFAKPIFDELKADYTELTAELQKPGARDSLRGLGEEIATVVHVGAGLVEWAVRHANVLVPLAKTVAEVTLAISALRLAQTALAIGSRVAGWVAETFAVNAHTAAVVKDTEAETLNAAAKTRNAAASMAAAEAEGMEAIAAAARMRAGLGPTAASLGGAGAAGVGAAAAGGGAASLTFGSAALMVGTGIVAFQGGRAIREGYTHEERDAQEMVDSGPVIQREFARIDAIRQQVAESHSLEEQERANKALAEEIAAVQERITAAKEKDTPASQANLPILSQQLHSLERIQAGFSDIVGTRQHTLTTEERIGDELDKQKETAREIAEALKTADKLTTEIRGHQEQDRFAALSPEGQMDDLKKQRAELVKKLEASPINTLPALPPGQERGEQSLNTYVSLANRKVWTDSKDPKELQQRDEYLAMVRQLQEVQEKQGSLQQQMDTKRDQATNKATSDADRENRSTYEQVQRGFAANQDQQDELAISRAKLNDNEQLARYLEYQLRLRHEIRSLEESKAPQEAIAAARERLGIEYQLSEEKIRQRDADKEARGEHHTRRPEHEHHRRGEHEGVPTEGYRARPHDAGYAGPGGGVGQSTAARELAKMTGDPDHDPAAHLARRPSAMEAADLRREREHAPNVLAPLFAGSPLGSFFGAPPAATSLAPALDRVMSVGPNGMLPGLGAPLPSGGESGDVASAGTGAYHAGLNALGAATGAFSRANRGGGGSGADPQKLHELEDKFKTLEKEFNDLAQDVHGHGGMTAISAGSYGGSIADRVSTLEGQIRNTA